MREKLFGHVILYIIDKCTIDKNTKTNLIIFFNYYNQERWLDLVIYRIKAYCDKKVKINIMYPNKVVLEVLLEEERKETKSAYKQYCLHNK